MKICIPVDNSAGLDSRTSEHFGRAPFHAILETKTEEISIVPNTSHSEGSCDPLASVQRAGAQAVICQGMGMHAVEKLNWAGIPVFVAKGATVREVAHAIQNRQLAELRPSEGCRCHGTCDESSVAASGSPE